MKPRPVIAIILCLGIYLLWIWSSTQKHAREEEATKARLKQAQEAARLLEEVKPAGDGRPGREPATAPVGKKGAGPGAAAGSSAAGEGQKPSLPRPVWPPQVAVMSRNPSIRWTVTSHGGSLASVSLSRFKNYTDPSRDLVLLPEPASGPTALAFRLERPNPADPPYPQLENEDWETVLDPEKDAVTFKTHVDDAEGQQALAITKKIAAEPDQSHLKISVTVENTSKARQSFQYTHWGPTGMQSESIRSPGQDLSVVSATFASNGPPVVTQNPITTIAKGGTWENPSQPAWVGCMNNYFAAILAPCRDNGAPSPEVVAKSFAETFTEPASLEQLLHKNHPGRTLADLTAEERKNLEEKALKTARTAVRSKLIDLEPGTSRTDHYFLYLGTRESAILNSYDNFNFNKINGLGITTWLVSLFLWVLPGLQFITRSWGLSIVLLTILVRLSLHPINRRQQIGMMQYQKKMQKIQPQLNELKERHGDNRLKMNQEMQKLFKENNVNPAQMMGGCMMIFLQFPVWIGLIETLGFAIFLRQAPFLWIQDLSQPDRLFTVQHNLWLLPNDINILPVVYVALMMVQQKMQPKPTDPQALQAQKMMSFMMIAFGFIFYGFPSGLLVYFLASAIFGLGETKIIKRIIKRREVEDAGVTVLQTAAGPAAPGAGAPMYQASKGIVRTKKAPKEKGLWR